MNLQRNQLKSPVKVNDMKCLKSQYSDYNFPVHKACRHFHNKEERFQARGGQVTWALLLNQSELVRCPDCERGYDLVCPPVTHFQLVFTSEVWSPAKDKTWNIGKKCTNIFMSHSLYLSRVKMQVIYSSFSWNVMDLWRLEAVHCHEFMSKQQKHRQTHV